MGRKNGRLTPETFMCKQKPFGDFCSETNPASYIGSMAWEEYDGQGIDEISPVITQKLDCIPLSTEDGEFHPGDFACDDQYVWQCRAVTANDWCNLHLPKSALGHLAWELVDGQPHSVSMEEMHNQHRNTEYEEPSEAELLNRIH